VVAHRLSTIRDADLILVMDEGRVVERGTHDELAGRSGVYAELIERQVKRPEVQV
jgi:ABC-type multidrug transport system fused ATPase/permease subunit